MNREKLKNELRMLKEENKLTLEEIGNLTETSSSTISRIIRGKDSVTKSMLNKIEEALRILKDQTEDQIENQIKEQIVNKPANKPKNTDDLFFEVNETKFKIDKKNKCLYVKSKDVELKIPF